MKNISKFATSKIKKLKPYVAASQDIWNKNSKTKLKLDWNEGVVEPPKEITSSATNYLNMDILKYYPNVRNDNLLIKIAKFLECDTNNISYFSGIDSLHEYIARAFLEKNDKVAMLMPTYDNFRAVCDASDAEVIKLDYFNNGKHSQTKKFNTKIVYFANPNNPTGELISQQCIKEILTLNDETLFVIDEAYIEFGGESAVSLVAEFKNVLVCRTLSKAFCLAGIRFGYCVAHEEIVNSLNSIRNPKSVTMLSQIIAEKAISENSYMLKNVESTNQAKDLLTKFLEKKIPDIEIRGESGNFLLLIFKNEKLLVKFINSLEERGIFIRNSTKLVKNSCRVTVPPVEKLDYLLNCIEEFT
tara:strand:- start:442 stop:1515 length:1074 start_codon:yes stop_codon:yes gene_type:complete